MKTKTQGKTLAQELIADLIWIPVALVAGIVIGIHTGEIDPGVMHEGAAALFGAGYVALRIGLKFAIRNWSARIPDWLRNIAAAVLITGAGVALSGCAITRHADGSVTVTMSEAEWRKAIQVAAAAYDLGVERGIIKPEDPQPAGPSILDRLIDIALERSRAGDALTVEDVLETLRNREQ